MSRLFKAGHEETHLTAGSSRCYIKADRCKLDVQALLPRALPTARKQQVTR